MYNAIRYYGFKQIQLILHLYKTGPGQIHVLDIPHQNLSS